MLPLIRPKKSVLVTRICPNCNHTRLATESAPDWQCPACGKAYNKGAGAAVSENYGRQRYESPEAAASSGSGLLKCLLILAIAGAGLWFSRPLWQGAASLSAIVETSAPHQQPEIILYATEWCGYCAAAREFFVANGIRYTELDVEKTREGYEGHRKLGGNGVPIIAVGDDVVHGFNEAELRSLLKPWLKRS